MSANLQISSDPVTAANACASHVTGLLGDALAHHEHATFAVSGGSSPKLMFERLASVSLPWDRIHIFFVDERCVPPDDDQSNYKMITAHFIQPAKIPHQNVHRIQGEIEPADGASRYSADIREFFKLTGNALPVFDVLHLGMGPDGHTASLFPGTSLIDDGEGIAAAGYVEKFRQWRVTLLPGVLLSAGNIVYLVAGEDKAEAARAVLQGGYDPKTYPAQIVARQDREAAWFMDESAARLVK